MLYVCQDLLIMLHRILWRQANSLIFAIKRQPLLTFTNSYVCPLVYALLFRRPPWIRRYLVCAWIYAFRTFLWFYGWKDCKVEEQVIAYGTRARLFGRFGMLIWYVDMTKYLRSLLDFLWYGAGRGSLRSRSPHKCRPPPPSFFRPLWPDTVSPVQCDSCRTSQGQDWKVEIFRGHADSDNTIYCVTHGLLGFSGMDSRRPTAGRYCAGYGFWISPCGIVVCSAWLSDGQQVYTYPQTLNTKSFAPTSEKTFLYWNLYLIEKCWWEFSIYM